MTHSIKYNTIPDDLIFNALPYYSMSMAKKGLTVKTTDLPEKMSAIIESNIGLFTACHIYRA